MLARESAFESWTHWTAEQADQPSLEALVPHAAALPEPLESAIPIAILVKPMLLDCKCVRLHAAAQANVC